jgi:hypothetical protein
VLQASARGAIANGLTQGIAVATGLQRKFDWVGVAAAGIGAGVAMAAGQGLGARSLAANHSVSNHLANGASNLAGAIANAATRSLIRGSDFGDNPIAALPDVIGQTIGNAISLGVNFGDSRSQFL